LLAFLAVAAWSRRRDVPVSGPFALLMFAMAVYTFGYAGEVAQTTVGKATGWLHVEYLALPWTPALWVLTTLRHNQIRARTHLLFVIPVITFIGHFLNPGGLFYTAPMEIEQRGPFWVLVMHRGPLSLLDNAYLLVAFLVVTGVYLSVLRASSALYRRQATILLLSSVLPFFGYFAYLANLSPWGLDISPVTLGCTCILLYYGYFRAGIFDLAPLARNLIFNTIRDGVLIVDNQSRLLDFNPAAGSLLPDLDKSSIGEPIEELVQGVPGLVAAVRPTEPAREFTFGGEAGPRIYEIRTWPLFTGSSGSKTKQVGRAIIFADVTAQVLLREELRSRAETDPLTGVANRRRFHQALEMECLRFGRARSPLSLLMIDLDHFKSVNDRYGHPAGDVVLREAADRLMSSLRKTDLLARYGGEEFAILLPDTPYEGASVMAERICKAMAQQPFEVEGQLIGVTVSVGVASHANDREVDPEILLKKADLALYRAKATGRNRVEVV